MATAIYVAAAAYMAYSMYEQNQQQKAALKEQKKMAAEAREQFQAEQDRIAEEKQDAIDAAKAEQEAEVRRRRGGLQNIHTSPLGVGAEAATTLGA